LPLGDVVALAGKGAGPAIGERVRQDPCGVAQHRHAVFAVDDQRRGRDLGDQIGREGEVADDRRVIEEGVGDGLQRGAEGGVAQLRDDVLGNADVLGLVELDRVAAATGGDQLGELLGQVGRRSWAALVDQEGRLVERQLGDRQPVGGGVQGEGGAGGVAEDRRGSPGLGDERVEVLDLALLPSRPPCRRCRRVHGGHS